MNIACSGETYRGSEGYAYAVTFAADDAAGLIDHRAALDQLHPVSIAVDQSGIVGRQGSVIDEDARIGSDDGAPVGDGAVGEGLLHYDDLNGIVLEDAGRATARFVYAVQIFVFIAAAEKTAREIA